VEIVIEDTLKRAGSKSGCRKEARKKKLRLAEIGRRSREIFLLKSSISNLQIWHYEILSQRHM